MALFQEVPSEAVDHGTRDFTAQVLGLVEDDLQLTRPGVVYRVTSDPYELDSNDDGFGCEKN